jgi:hypothetical protein
MTSGIPKKKRLADGRRRKAAKPAGAWVTASKSPLRRLFPETAAWRARWGSWIMKKLISVRQALEDPAWLGGMLGAESFAVMRALLIAAMGEALTADEMPIFTQLTGRTETPGEAVEELWVIARRRSGKTRAIGTLAAYLAGCCDHRAILGPGERGVLPIMAANTLQAGQIISSGAFSRTSRGLRR